jgi:membrane-associated phospholipid phosphatase
MRDLDRMHAKETYIKRMEYFKEHPGVCRAMKLTGKLATGIVFLAYPLLLGWLLFHRAPELAGAIIVPLDGFLILTVFRWLINRKRPYEVYDTPPAIPKDKKGSSFPSRHVYSAFAIAFAFAWIGSVLEIPAVVGLAAGLALLGVLLAVIRVLSGIHFLSDVLAGAAWAVLVSVAGYVFF